MAESIGDLLLRSTAWGTSGIQRYAIMPWDRRCASFLELEVHSSIDQARLRFA
jgi:hypothetical protein